jgi:hypothetical protein
LCSRLENDSGCCSKASPLWSASSQEMPKSSPRMSIRWALGCGLSIKRSATRDTQAISCLQKAIHYITVHLYLQIKPYHLFCKVIARIVLSKKTFTFNINYHSLSPCPNPPSSSSQPAFQTQAKPPTKSSTKCTTTSTSPTCSTTKPK